MIIHNILEMIILIILEEKKMIIRKILGKWLFSLF